MKSAMFLCLSLAATPFAACRADDQETQQLHNNTYQQYAAAESCPYQGDCAIVFPKTEHITTAITAVSCYFSLPSGTTIIFTSVGSQDSNARSYLQPFAYGYLAGSVRYGINSATNLFISKGDEPRIDVYTSGAAVTSLSCTISGYHS